MINYDEIKQIVERLENWIKNSQWKGYDPFDIKGNILMVKLYRFCLNNSIFKRYLRKGVDELIDHFPIFLRKNLRIKPEFNPKGVALVAQSYFNLFKITDELQYLDVGKKGLELLKELKNCKYTNNCWGYPFDWQSRVFFPKNTPSAVVSTTCGNAFLEGFFLTKRVEYLQVAKSVSTFLTENLNIKKYNGDKICFSYTPIDHFHVHNANVLTAEYLIKIGSITDNNQLIELGQKAINYTIKDQNNNGSFYYWGPPDKRAQLIDNFHTGYIIRALYRGNMVLNDERIKKSLDIAVKFYLRNFFSTEGIPKHFYNKNFPIDIHGCAESIILLSTLNLKEIVHPLLKNVICWTVQNMWSEKSGYFYYKMKKDPLFSLKYIVKIPYYRWSNAWMFKALTTFLVTKKLGEDQIFIM